MRSSRHLMTAVAAVVLGIALVAGTGKAGTKKKTTESPKELKKQTHCLVMGGEIDTTMYVDMQGQRVYLCCPMCADKLRANPDKYFEKAAAEGVLLENVQTLCPVSGEKLKDNKVYVDYQGRRIFFCCENCVGKFNKNPEKYLQKLDESTDAAETKDVKSCRGSCGHGSQSKHSCQSH